MAMSFAMGADFMEVCQMTFRMKKTDVLFTHRGAYGPARKCLPSLTGPLMSGACCRELASDHMQTTLNSVVACLMTEGSASGMTSLLNLVFAPATTGQQSQGTLRANVHVKAGGNGVSPYPQKGSLLDLVRGESPCLKTRPTSNSPTHCGRL